MFGVLDTTICNTPFKVGRERYTTALFGYLFSVSYHESAVGAASIVLFIRSEQTIGEVRYLGGWLVFPSSATQTAPQVLTSIGLLTTRLAPLYPAIQGGPQAVINEHTGALLFAPILTATDIAAGQVQVPSLGSFVLTQCRQANCH